MCPVCPKHVEQAIRSAIKIHLLHLVGILFPDTLGYLFTQNFEAVINTVLSFPFLLLGKVFFLLAIFY